MSSEVLIFVLSISGALIVGLAVLLWWFIRERMAQREKQQDLLDKRLGAGSETMQRMTARIEQMQGVQISQFATVVHQEKFDGYLEEHKVDHKEIDNRIETIHHGQDRIRDEVREVGARLDAGMSTMTGLLSKIVVIPGNVEDEE